ncbi:hypothetical protein Hanom_Chr02g00176851 [Helianthus anomalus]
MPSSSSGLINKLNFRLKLGSGSARFKLFLEPISSSSRVTRLICTTKKNK